MDIEDLAKFRSVITLLEAVDLDTLLTGMNRAPIDMPALMEKHTRLRAQVRLDEIGGQDFSVIEVLLASVNLGLDVAIHQELTKGPILISTFEDIDEATALRNHLIALGAIATLDYTYD